MKNRYMDESKLVKNAEELKLVNETQVPIFYESKFYNEVVVELGRLSDKFEEVKPLIIFIAENLCEMDRIAQKYSGGSQFVYEYEVSTVYIDAPDTIRLTYYGMIENTEFDVVFQRKDDNFILKSFGMEKNIPRDWSVSGFVAADRA